MARCAASARARSLATPASSRCEPYSSTPAPSAITTVAPPIQGAAIFQNGLTAAPARRPGGRDPARSAGAACPAARCAGTAPSRHQRHRPAAAPSGRSTAAAAPRLRPARRRTLAQRGQVIPAGRVQEHAPHAAAAGAGALLELPEAAGGSADLAPVHEPTFLQPDGQQHDARRRRVHSCRQQRQRRGNRGFGDRLEVHEWLQWG